MHVAFFTILMVVGAGQPVPEPAESPAAVAAPESDCGPACDCAKGRHAPRDGGEAGDGIKTWLCDWFGPMPQTCYGSRFGCYPGNNGRDIHRQPAFHGYYYREPYNYRHYFDYPWHAEPHEPIGYFSHQGDPQGGLTPTPDPGRSAPMPAPPAPVPAPRLEEPQARAQSFGKARLLGR